MDTREKIRQFILSAFYVPEPARLTDDTSLIGAGIVDSTGLLDVIAHLEAEHGIAVEELEVVPENFDSIRGLVGFVSRKTGAGSQSG